MILSLEKTEDIKNFIHTTESNLYGGKNTAGETIAVALQQGVGMEVRTFQKNGWIRVTSYDKDGYLDGETFDGRYKKGEDDNE